MPKVVGFDSPKKTKCHNCGAIIEYQNNEVHKQFIKCALTGGDDYYSINCPNCHKSVEVPAV